MSYRMIDIDISIVKELKAKVLRHKESDTREQREAKHLAAKIIGLVQGGGTMANNWGFYLFSDELDSEPQLRNKITVIMISGLLDTVEAENRVLDTYKAQAEENGYSNMVLWCEKAREWCEAAQGVLNLFSMEEQLFIQDFRNKLVHGWLNKTHQEEFNVKYFNGVEIVSEKINRDAYNDIIKVPMLGVRDGNIIFQKSSEDTLAEFATKFINLELDYWRIANVLNSEGYMDNVCQQIYSDIGVSWTPGLNLFEEG